MILAPTKPVVFVIEDDSAMQSLLTDFLFTQGYAAHGFRTGQMACDQLIFFKEPIGLIIADFQLPDITGFEVLKFVQIHRPEVPLIMISGFSDRAIEQEAIQSGAAAFLRKPFPLNQLGIKVSLHSA